MKRFLLLLLLLPMVAAQPTDWFQAALVKTQLDVSSTIDLVESGPNPFVENLRADVIFVPQNSEYLAVRQFESVPTAVLTGDRARFEWKAPAIGELSFRYTALVDVANNAPRVTAKIPFPIEIPRGFEKYVQATKNIDSNDARILGQAHALSQGEDDLFVVVSKLAMWVKNNVDYNLSTLTAEVTQPASWVLENRFGVCDELTGLFIAMLRSLNIPARFISGIAFTNSPQFPQGWGAHGWAEVYFPGVGWVPFDPTFGEFGWVDPGHIKLKESLDPQEPTTVFEWKSRDVEVNVNDLVLNAVNLDFQGKVPFDLKISAYPLRPRVGFDSYNGIVLDIENLADYYVAPEFALSRVTDMDILNGEIQQIILPPGGTGKVFWKLQVRENLDPNFQYELPILVYTIRNDSASSSFASGRWDVVFSRADIESEIDRLSVTELQPFDLACALESDRIWNDDGKINCIVKNRLSHEISVTVCSKGCRQLTVPPQQNVPVSFNVLAQTPGPHEVEVSATYDDLEKKAVLTIVRLDRPRIVIRDLSIPPTANYGAPFLLSFTLARESVSTPQNVTVRVKGGGSTAQVDVGNLVVDQEVNINIRSDQLYSSSPDFDIDVSYSDPFGDVQHARNSASIKVSNVPWYKRMIGWFIDLF